MTVKRMEAIAEHASKSKKPIADKVVKHILRLVQIGVLAPGQKLPSERDLAASMGVGRPSLREGLRALSLMGIVEIRHGDGIFVSNLTPDSVLEPLKFFLSLDPPLLEALFEARVAVEAGIVEVAASKIDSDLLLKLNESIHEGAALIYQPEAFKEVDVRFHRLIVEATQNSFLIRLAESLQELGSASRAITVAISGVAEQSHVDHIEIVAALERRSPREAREAMVKHLRNVQSAFHLSRFQR